MAAAKTIVHTRGELNNAVQDANIGDIIVLEPENQNGVIEYFQVVIHDGVKGRKSIGTNNNPPNWNALPSINQNKNKNREPGAYRSNFVPVSPSVSSSPAPSARLGYRPFSIMSEPGQYENGSENEYEPLSKQRKKKGGKTQRQKRKVNRKRTKRRPKSRSPQ